MGSSEAEVIIKSFLSYLHSHAKDKEVVVLPEFFMEARRLFTKDQLRQFTREIYGNTKR